MTKSLEALIADIESAVENATQGTWCTDSSGGLCAEAGLNNNFYVANCSGPEHRSNARFIASISPENIKMLIAALEQAQRENKAQSETIASLTECWNDGRKRIAELESRQLSVKLPMPYGINVAGERVDWKGGDHYDRDEVVEAIRTAGGIVEGGE